MFVITRVPRNPERVAFGTSCSPGNAHKNCEVMKLPADFPEILKFMKTSAAKTKLIMASVAKIAFVLFSSKIDDNVLMTTKNV